MLDKDAKKRMCPFTLSTTPEIVDSGKSWTATKMAGGFCITHDCMAWTEYPNYSQTTGIPLEPRGQCNLIPLTAWDKK